jgi:3-isopropylmalate/(R)-2-methylmalate dehydratase small subunit
MQGRRAAQGGIGCGSSREHAPWALAQYGFRAVEFPVDSFAKQCLLNGVDELGHILQQESAIAAYEAAREFPVHTR